MTALPQEKKYTYADYLEWPEWPEGERVELIDGDIYAMAPGPSAFHQNVGGEIYTQLKNYLRGKKCRVFMAPLDVRLFETATDAPSEVDTVVQPDVMVVCDRSKIDRRGIHGAPDLVVEVLSPGSKRMDRLIKFNLYQRAGVREYWIVSPEEKSVQVFVLEDGRYSAVGYYGPGDQVKVAVLEDCVIDLEQVFVDL